MANALNLTARLKQDSRSQETLKQLVATFADAVQPKLEAALSESKIVHFARVVLIGSEYIQVLTEFDGDPLEYTEFFRLKLSAVFELVFSLVEGAPPWSELNNADAFHEFTLGLNLPALGKSVVGNAGRGYLFSALGNLTVAEIQAKLK